MGAVQDLLREWPVRAGECADDVWPGIRKDIVYRVARCNDTFASCNSRASGKPTHNITCFFIVECLVKRVSRGAIQSVNGELTIEEVE